MDGIVAIKEEREFITKFRKFYQEKIVDTGLSKGFDKMYGGVNKIKTFIANAVIRITGSAGTIAAAVCPADGPVGEVVIGAITVALPAAITAAGELDTKLMTGAKDLVETKVIGVEKPEEEKEKIMDLESIKELKNQFLDEKDKLIEAFQKQREIEQENDAPSMTM